MDLFITKEGQSFTFEKIKQIKNLNLDFSCNPSEIKFLGLNPNCEASYFIGVDWLKVNEAIIQVDPKIQRLDFMAMFLECLNTPYLNQKLREIYFIDFKNPQIEIDSISCDITPLLIIHFLNIVKKISNKGLKKDYIRVEENISKIKGKIKFSQQFKYNISRGRLNKNYCNYQEYSVDCLENQLLKKTLLFSGSYINKFYPNKQLQLNLHLCLSAFELVSDNVDAVMIKQVHINPVYKEYAEALTLAKLIMKRFAYSMSETTKCSQKKTPPFWIDMSLLFEIYVLGKLKEAFGSKLHYQVDGKYGVVDFIDNEKKIVIDAKYKLIYNENKFDIDNIRQVSAYARDKGIRNKLKASENELLPCCIIYPNKSKEPNFANRNLLEEKIEQFEKFWKIGICLPYVG